MARSVRKFLVDLRDAECGNLHALVMQEVEAPLYAEVLRHCDGNLTRAAGVLGINRATLRKRLRELGLAD